jgi:hypothetical protein
MRVVLSDLLAEQAASVDLQGLDPDELVADGRRALRNRRRVAVAAAAACTAVALGTAALVVGGDGDAEISPAPPVDGGVPRVLTFGQGQNVHLGDRTIDTDLDFLSIDVTDDGAVLTTLDGGVWFTDGSTVESIGSTAGAGDVTSSSVTWPHGRPPDWVRTDSAGSLAAWLEYPRRREIVLVVYDTDLRREVGRHSFEVAARAASRLDALVDGRAYVAVTAVEGGVDSVVAWDAFSGERDYRRASEPAPETRGRVRSLVLGSPDGRVLGAGRFVYTEPQDRLVVDGGRLTGDSQGLQLFDGASGDRVVLDVPDGFETGAFYPVEWLDDDRIAMIYGNLAPDGDLLVCRLSAHRCEVAIDRDFWTVSPLLPGEGGVGAEYALGLVLHELGGPPQ